MSNDNELKIAVEKANELIQEITDYLGENNNKDAKLRFPRGYIKTTAHYRKKLSFIKDPILLSNSSYTLMLLDVYRWIVNRTDIWGAPRDMLIKHGICIIGSLCESFTKDALKEKVNAKKSYKSRTAYLVDKNLIDDKQKQELDWVWDTRNNQHLFLVTFIEFEHYKAKDYNRANNAFKNLCESLSKL